MEFSQAQIIDRFQRKVGKRKMAKLQRWIDREKSKMDIARSDFIQRHLKYLDNYDDFITFIRKGPWDGCANMHMPLTALMVKEYHSRLYNIFSDENTAQLRPRSAGDEDLTMALAKLRKWYLFDYINEYRGIRGFVRESMWDVVTVGYAIGMKDYLVKERKSLVIEPKQLINEVNDMEKTNPQLTEPSAKPEIVNDEESEPPKVDISMYQQVEKVLRVFEGSRVRSIPFENVLFPNTIQESNNLDEPPLVIVQTEIDLSAIALKVAQGDWSEDGFKEIEEETSAKRSDQSGMVKDRRSKLTGYTEVSPNEDTRLIEYCFCSYDVDDDGINEELLLIRSPNQATLKIVDLDQISRTGMRPLIKFDCFTKSRQSYSRGVPEFMFPLNEEIDRTHNARSNYMDLQTLPWGVYRANSSLKNEPIKLAPGKFIPVDDTADLKIMSFPANAQLMQGEEQLLWNYAERLCATSSLSQGMVPEQVGPTRSTSGVTTLLRQMEKQFKVTIDQNAAQWRKLEMLLLDDLDRRIPPQAKMRVLGPEVENYFGRYYPDAKNSLYKILSINAQFDVFIDVAEIVRSDELRRSESEMILNKVAAPSIMQQFGVVTPKTLYKALSNYLKAYNLNPKDYINEPEYTDKALTLYQEIQYCAQGVLPPMSMQDNHLVKAQKLVAFMQQPPYAEAKMNGLYVAHMDEMMMQAAQKHVTLDTMMRPKELPNPTGANEQNPNMVGSGNAPQQGGNNPNKTTSRQLKQPEENNANKQGRQNPAGSTNPDIK
jgi:hypothetical protein